MSYLAIAAEPIPEQSKFTGNDFITRKKQKQQTQKYRETTFSSDEYNPQKVNSVLKSIHNRPVDDDDDLGDINDINNGNQSGGMLLDYHRSMHTSATGSNSRNDSNSHNNNGSNSNSNNGSNNNGNSNGNMEGMSNFVPQPIDQESLELQNLQSAYMSDNQVKEYYRKMGARPQPQQSQRQQQQQQQMQPQPHNQFGGSGSGNCGGSSGFQSSGFQSSGFQTNYNSGDSQQMLLDKMNYMINLLEEQQDQRTDSVTEDVILYSFLGVFMIFIVDSFTKVGKYVR